MGDRALHLPLDDPDKAAGAVVELAGRSPLDAVVAVDDQGVMVAALAAARLGLPHNPPAAVAATRDKAATRALLAAAGLPQPRWRVVDPGAGVAALATEVGLPCVEETIYVTPSRLPAGTQEKLTTTTAAAAAALGLVEGPVHAEARITPGGEVVILELAARSIGGLCSRSLRFGTGVSLEELILRHALGLPLDPTRESAAAGVMMLPIPSSGTLRRVGGQDDARSTPGITGLELSILPGRPVRPLPEGDRYLGFLFARGETPEEVEAALRAAHARLDVVIDPLPSPSRG
jgi:biotin carboxylase